MQIGWEDLKETPTFGDFFTELEQKGMEKGIEKGKKEATYNLAEELMRDGFSNERIAKLTKLELEKVVTLRKSL